MTEETIFATALEKKTAAERQAFLDQACAGKPELRSAVDGLLLAEAAAGSFMQHPPAGVAQHGTADGRNQDTVTSGEWSASLRFLEPCDKPGRIGILDQYEIIEVVGHGGMGAVMRAFDPRLSRVVAVKVMSPGLATNPMAVKRFLREATTAASIHHDHVVTIHAVNDSHLPPYLVMQFVEGRTLQQKIDQEGALGLKHILRIGSQTAAGLAAAHKLGVIHRDVKPANILLENGVERVKISDFGLARAADDVHMTQTGIIAGTPQYMSPEQAKGEPIDARSDLFALGSVVYTMCTGRSPFRADNPLAVLRRVCDDTPRPIRASNPEIPAWLEAIVNKLLAKNPNDRLQTASEVAELLSQHLAHEQNAAIVPWPAEIVTRESQSKSASEKPKRSWLRPAIFTMAAAILLLIGLSLTEAAGVTHVAATIVRIATGEGTLVIEADDPNVKVAINGEEVTIHGAGIEEVRLRPGSYKLAASKDGQPVTVDQEFVKISRGGIQVVRVAVEHSKPQAEQEKTPIAGWQPPKNPDPVKILLEAQVDALAGSYESALAKHVWYHQHALEFHPTKSTARLTSALSSWCKLCKDYPPALDKLLAIRDEAIATAKEGRNLFRSFQDLVMINRIVDQEDVTREVFAFLHANRPADAQRVFAIAEPSLIKAKAYDLCGDYLAPDQVVPNLRRMRQLNKDLAPKLRDGGRSLLEFEDRNFTNKVATAVALLVVLGRQAEAERVVAEAKKEWDDARFHAKLADALKGNVPEPWPAVMPEIRATKRSSTATTAP